MKPAASLFAKIVAWFFLNLILVAAALATFFTFQQHLNLHAIFGQEATNRLRTASLLIAHDLSRRPRAQWPQELARHAAIHRVDFTVVLQGGSRFSSTDNDLPETVMARVQDALRHQPPRRRFPPPHDVDPQRLPPSPPEGDPPNHRAIERKPPMPPTGDENQSYFMMRTRHPIQYWSAILIPLPPGPLQPPEPAMFLAVSDTMTGNGFFFDPLPWMVVTASVILISVLFWFPMVSHITRPLARMTRAAEQIAKGRFDVPIQEARTDEIGRLAKSISHMSGRLSAFVKGQKRFLGDVAHELGSPIARIQFGLGALEQRIGSQNRQRAIDVMEDVDHLSKLVNELLAFSRAEMKSNTVKLENIALSPVIHSAVKREMTPAATINIRTDSGIRVVASAELLTRAIANLVRNAVKYAGDAGPIEVTAEEVDGGVVIEVRDMGSGVPENLLDQLFEPFFRPETSRNRDSGGVGLGLAIVRTCVETCNGTVSAANRQPEGFTVTIILAI